MNHRLEKQRYDLLLLLIVRNVAFSKAILRNDRNIPRESRKNMYAHSNAVHVDSFD